MSTSISQINLFAAVPPDTADVLPQSPAADESSFDQALAAASQSSHTSDVDNAPAHESKPSRHAAEAPADDGAVPVDTHNTENEDLAASVIAAFLQSAFPPVEETSSETVETDQDKVAATDSAGQVASEQAAAYGAENAAEAVEAILPSSASTEAVSSELLASTQLPSSEESPAITQALQMQRDSSEGAIPLDGFVDSDSIYSQPNALTGQPAQTDADEHGTATTETPPLAAAMPSDSNLSQHTGQADTDTSPVAAVDPDEGLPETENLQVEGWTNERVVNVQQSAAAVQLQQEVRRLQTSQEVDTSDNTAGPAESVNQAAASQIQQPAEPGGPQTQSEEGRSNSDYSEIARAESDQSETAEAFNEASQAVTVNAQATQQAPPPQVSPTTAAAAPVFVAPTQASQNNPAPESIRPTSDIATNTIDQIVRSAQLSAKRGVTDLTVRLDPPDLGTLHVKISMQSGTGELAASIRADLSNTHSLIAANQEQIKEALQQAGLRLQQIQVQDFAGSTFQQFNSHSNGNNPYQQPQTPLPLFAALESGVSASVNPALVQQISTGNSLINSFA